jgi:hypothetical protein
VQARLMIAHAKSRRRRPSQTTWLTSNAARHFMSVSASLPYLACYALHSWLYTIVNSTALHNHAVAYQYRRCAFGDAGLLDICMSAKVVKGFGRGSKLLGIPTANSKCCFCLLHALIVISSVALVLYYLQERLHLCAS